MRVRALCREAAACRARDEAVLQQVRLVYFANGIGLLADCRREALDADRAAIEFIDDCAQDGAVHAIETACVDFEQFESAERHFARHDWSFVDLREVAHAAQEPIRDPRRSARTRREFRRAIVVELDAAEARRAAYDF